MTEEYLKVSSCNLLKEKNGPSHHTDDYDTVSTRLIVRRGQSFVLRVEFNRATDFPNDKIRFEFEAGGNPSVTQKSKVHMNRIDPGVGDATKVGVKFSSINTGKVVDFEFYTPSDMGVNQWTLIMYAKSKSKRSEKKSTVSKDIVVLFNAWNKDDDVYMENEKWRKEYVLNDIGRQYYGSARHIGGMNWYFGQFEKEILEVVLNLFKSERMRYRNRGDAIEVSRFFSAVVNSNDDEGILVGNWSGDYEDGKNPSDWTGSHNIFKTFLETEEPVQYGQCWVFAGVLCTALRAVGIPARCNTNFESAHDTDANLTIDYHYDENGKALDNDDSVWNFHVWNDVWMARSDLPKGFGGWQALDATPQEESSGKMRCGPMSVNAIKQGLVYMDYDGPFIYAEVNGVKRHWKKEKKGVEKYKEMYSDIFAVGKNMSTKAVGSNDREDVTRIYKYADGTPEEAMSFKMARKYVKYTKSDREKTKDVIKFEGHIPDVVPIGKDITGTFKFTNISKTSQTVFLSLVGKVMQYNGSVVAKIYDSDVEETIAAGSSKEVKLTLPAKTYLAKVKNNDSIKYFGMGGVKGTGDNTQTFVYQDIVDLGKPEIKVTASGSKFKSGDSVSLTVSFTNPLTTSLQPGKLRIEGSGLIGLKEIPVSAVKGGATFKETIKITPYRVGTREIIVGYASPSLHGLRGNITFTVTK